MRLPVSYYLTLASIHILYSYSAHLGVATLDSTSVDRDGRSKRQVTRVLTERPFYLLKTAERALPHCRPMISPTHNGRFQHVLSERNEATHPSSTSSYTQTRNMISPLAHSWVHSEQGSANSVLCSSTVALKCFLAASQLHGCSDEASLIFSDC